MRRYALVGAAGFVAPRHMKAIYDTGGVLTGAIDPHDSVGILDRYDKNIEFFVDQARFERWLYKTVPDFLVVCAPNHLHETYVRMGLQAGCDVICEKPLALNPDNLDLMEQLQAIYGKRVYTVLQLRLQAESLRGMAAQGHHTVDVRYIAPRGNWYHQSWKADEEKSGGIITNIGIHLFDVLIYLFGEPKVAEGLLRPSTAQGSLALERADVNWELSIQPESKPERRFFIDGDAGIDLSGGFDDAHTRVYEEILAGRGFGIADARPAVELCWHLRDNNDT